MSLSLIKHWKALLIAALVLSLLGLKLSVLAVHGSDIPSPGEWTTEVDGLYRPWLHRTSDQSGVLDAVISRPDPAARVWKLLWLRGNGQWDPRFLALAATGLFGLAAALFFLAIFEASSPLAALIVASAGFLLFAFPCVLEPTLDSSQAWIGFLLLFSAAHLAGAARSRPSPTQRRIGHLAGLANVLASTAGLASPLAVLIWMALNRRGDASSRRQFGQSQSRRREDTSPHLPVLWNVMLIALGVGRLMWAIPQPHWPTIDGTYLLPLGAWPLAWPAMALFICAPALALLIRTFRRGPDRPPVSLARLASLWVLILMAAVACPGVVPAGAPPTTLLAICLLVQLSALLAFPASSPNGFITKAFATAVWLIVIFDGLFQQSRFLPDTEQRAKWHETQAAAARHFLSDQKLDDLRAISEGDRDRAQKIASLLSDGKIRAILPTSIRPPLALSPSPGPAAFQPGAAPDLDGKPELLPAWGTWKRPGPDASGQFVSEPLRTSAPMLQIYVAGSLHPPLASLVLQTADGRVISPLEPRAEATARWKPINFAAPAEPFRVVARDTEADHWLAFSAPLETGRLAWLGRKIAATWPWMLGLGVILLSYSGAGGVLAWRRERDAAHPPPAIPALAKHAPWLGVFVYGLFLTNFIDPYAAGSDAAGYLNSAKLLLQGQMTLHPRSIPGVSASLQLLTPLGFDVFHGKISPGYPVGLPLILAAVGRLSSLEFAIPVVVMAHLLLGIFFTRRLAEACGLARIESWVAAGLLALCPLYVFMGLQPMSDGPSLVWVTAALYFALSSRQKPRMALWSGAACAVAVLLRPANLICLLPIALALGLSARRLRLLVLGGLPGAIFAIGYNFHLYGSPFQTPYGDVGYLFAWHWVLPTVRSYLRWIPAYFTPFICLAVAGPWMRGLIRPARMALTGCVLIYFGFFSLYFFTHLTWWYLRFVLPAFPCLVILAVAVGKDLLTRDALRTDIRRATLVAVFLGLFACNMAWQFSRLFILYSGRGNEVYRDSALWIERSTPKDAVILAFQASGAVCFYTHHPLIRAEAETASESETVAAVRRLIALGQPVYALVLPFDSLPPFRRLPGHWENVAEVKTAEIWRLTQIFHEHEDKP